jgi:hypothetical protein
MSGLKIALMKKIMMIVFIVTPMVLGAQEPEQSGHSGMFLHTGLGGG